MNPRPKPLHPTSSRRRRLPDISVAARVATMLSLSLSRRSRSSARLPLRAGCLEDAGHRHRRLDRGLLRLCARRPPLPRQGLRPRSDAVVCRRLVATSCPFQGSTPPTALQVVGSKRTRLGPVVVVNVGYNDWPAVYDVDRVMRALKAAGVRSVIWVTLREATSYARVYAQSNARIRKRRAGGGPHRRRLERVQPRQGVVPRGRLHLTTSGALGLARLCGRSCSQAPHRRPPVHSPCGQPAELRARSGCFRLDNFAQPVDRLSACGDNLGTYVLFSLHECRGSARLDVALEDGLTPAPVTHTELERVGERLSSVVPPQNLEAEESVLGAMLLSPVAVGTVSEILDASDFYRESHAKMYRAALALWSKGEPVDAITLANELEERAELEAAGGRGASPSWRRSSRRRRTSSTTRESSRRCRRSAGSSVRARRSCGSGRSAMREGSEARSPISSIAPSRSSSSSASSARRATSRTSRCC